MPGGGAGLGAGGPPLGCPLWNLPIRFSAPCSRSRAFVFSFLINSWLRSGRTNHLHKQWREFFITIIMRFSFISGFRFPESSFPSSLPFINAQL